MTPFKTSHFKRAFAAHNLHSSMTDFEPRYGLLQKAYSVGTLALGAFQIKRKAFSIPCICCE